MTSNPNPSEVLDLASAFDRDYYLTRYPDVATAGCDPIWHYCVHGWREGRNPCAEFDTLYYLRTYTDIAEAGINPFWHYVVSGKAEGRAARPILAAVRQQLAKAWSNDARYALSNVQLGSASVLDAAELISIFRSETPTKDLVVAISHDDYGVSTGGVQNIIGDECEEFRRRGINYLHLCPARPKMQLSEDRHGAEFFFAARLNGQALGRISGAALERVIVEFKRLSTQITWVIHHVMGHSPELLKRLILTWRTTTPLFWTHDYFAACTGYTLMRNTLEYCGAPEPESSACRVCVYGTARKMHRERVADLIFSISPKIVSPSQRALELWERATGFSGLPTHVAPPANLVLNKKTIPHRQRQHSPLRIAHLGAPVFHKGWASFEKLAAALKNDSRYRFFQLGSNANLPSSITHVDALVKPGQRAAMIDAIVVNRIDVVVSWSLWPETFCFTAHEAIAAGAFLVHRRNQGHVDAAAAEYAAQAAREIEDEGELFSYFQSGKILTDVSNATLRVGALLPAVGSAEISLLNVPKNLN